MTLIRNSSCFVVTSWSVARRTLVVLQAGQSQGRNTVVSFMTESVSLAES